jgi:hypothetical protein
MHDTLLIKCYLNLQIHLHSKDGSLSYSQIHPYSSMGNKLRCWVGKHMLQMPIYCSQKHRKHRMQWSIKTNCEATTSHQLDWSSHLSLEIFLWPTISLFERKKHLLVLILVGTRLIFTDLLRQICTHQNWTPVPPTQLELPLLQMQYYKNVRSCEWMLSPF